MYYRATLSDNCTQFIYKSDSRIGSGKNMDDAVSANQHPHMDIVQIESMKVSKDGFLVPGRSVYTPADKYDGFVAHQARAQADYQAEYQHSVMKQIKFAVNRRTEADILERLDKQPNIRQYLIGLIRKDMNDDKQ